MEPIEDYGLADCSGDKKALCLGVYTIYRLSFSLVALHIILLVGSLATGAFSDAINSGCWLLKFLVLAALFVVTLFIPNEFFD